MPPRIFRGDLASSNTTEESMPLRPTVSIGKPVVMFGLVIEMYASKVFPISESGIAEKLERGCDSVQVLPSPRWPSGIAIGLAIAARDYEVQCNVA